MDKISALMDGELDEQETRRLLVRLRERDDLREDWDTFHVIGDALRGERSLSVGFGRRVSDRLMQEPTILAPQRGLARRIATYGLSAAASLAAVALVGWVAISTNSFVSPQPEIASAPSPVAAPEVAVAATVPPARPVSVPNEGRNSEYLLAHQEFSPSTAIQGVAPYIRNVSTATGQPAKIR
jgi:sigma-E factor negative regulatory protein RseA